MTKVEFKYLSVDDIHLDLENPRIAQWIEMYSEDSLSSEAISMALGVGEHSPGDSKTTYHSLRESIKTNKGLIHPIIVNKQKDDKYIVIEGNTRVSIIREFKKNGIEGEWNTVPSMVYDDLGQAEIDAIRLQAHLVGTREWRPYAKAKYLSSLRNKSHLTLAQIVDFCGGRKNEVNAYIDAYADIETYYRPLCEDGNFDPSRFSAFVELQKPSIQTAILEAGFNKTDFAKWIIDLKIKRLEKVRDLPRVLRNEKAKDVFLKKNIEEALKILEIPVSEELSLANATIYDLAKEICARISKIGWEEVQQLKHDNESDDANILFSARDRLVNLCDDISGDLDE